MLNVGGGELRRKEKLSGREQDWKRESDAETIEFLDDILAYFQEDITRINDFEAWKKHRKEESGLGVGS